MAAQQKLAVRRTRRGDVVLVAGEVLHVVLGHLGETKALHEAAKAEIQKLKREQAADMAKAQEAIAVLAARASENAALTSALRTAQPSFPEQADKGVKRRSSLRGNCDLSAWLLSARGSETVSRWRSADEQAER